MLEFLSRFIAEHGYPPSVREIGQHFHIQSLAGVTCHLDALQKKKFIERDKGKARGIRVVQ